MAASAAGSPVASLTDQCQLDPSRSTNAALGLRIAALFAILAASTIGGLLPLLSRNKFKFGFFLGKVFAAGVVTATGFVHILPDAVDALSNPCLGFSSSYPWAYTFAGGCALITFTLEYFLHRLFFRRARRAAAKRVAESNPEQHDLECPGCQEELQDSSFDSKHRSASGKLESVAIAEHTDFGEARRREATVVAYVLEAGVIFHSIFIGISLGITHDPDVARALLIALCFHQGFEGLAIGMAFMKAEYNKLKYLLFMLGFVLVTPIGISIGIGLSTSYNENGKVALGFEGAFNSASAGILIYNALVDLLMPAFQAEELPSQTWQQLLGFAFVFAGYCCMALLAIWA